jgi:hypothetical protein
MSQKAIFVDEHIGRFGVSWERNVKAIQTKLQVKVPYD